ncbi:2-amino-4-hydroxy-6-hydroxymethyldihydropteridine diphosphokinase [Pilimelia columellifera]|uniref:2-amino-4-hydroxy-6-hydroxymethyldihydropteridine diphosphokinase n=1 Tax=Pilimelia columellifera subsp. columellifera TaxID=706583 RepID=A0ABN3NDR8_9ACTN
MSRAVLGLGSNLGDRLAHLRDAVAALDDVLVLASGVYETPPWGDAEQPHYLNAVVLAVEPGAPPRRWLDRAQRLETAAGRVRDRERQFGPRTLDVDVIAVWDEQDEPVISDNPELTLPHPRAHLRAFVMRPWIDLQPYGEIPGQGWLTDLLQAEPARADVPDVRARPDLTLESR